MKIHDIFTPRKIISGVKTLFKRQIYLKKPYNYKINVNNTGNIFSYLMDSIRNLTDPVSTRTVQYNLETNVHLVYGYLISYM